MLLLATRNRHKVEEIADILPDPFEVKDLSFLPDAPTVEESGETFLENARLKAVAISELTDMMVLADDSGLEVDALGGDPGVYSARFAGPDATDADNNRKLLERLAGVADAERTGRFRCVMVVAKDGRSVAEFEGAVEGTILSEPRGKAGFGYDPLFVPEGRDLTMAELGAATKNAISHRAHALARFREWAESAL